MNCFTLEAALSPLGHTVVVLRSIDENWLLSSSNTERPNRAFPPSPPFVAGLYPSIVRGLCTVCSRKEFPMTTSRWIQNRNTLITAILGLRAL